MKTIKIILNQRVDLIFALITLGLFIWHLTAEQDVSGFLFIVFGYVVNVIINKVRLIRDGKIELKVTDEDISNAARKYEREYQASFGEFGSFWANEDYVAGAKAMRDKKIKRHG